MYLQQQDRNKKTQRYIRKVQFQYHIFLGFLAFRSITKCKNWKRNFFFQVHRRIIFMCLVFILGIRVYCYIDFLIQSAIRFATTANFQAKIMATISGQLHLNLFQSDFIDVHDIQSQGTAQGPRYLSLVAIVILFLLFLVPPTQVI